MRYRPLGKTGIEVSAVSLGAAQLASSETDYAVSVVHRALELGVNYIDTARGYGDSEVKLGIALEDRWDGVHVSTKTLAKDRGTAWRQIEESLSRLRTDHVTNLHLHSIESLEDLDVRMGKGGPLEALIEAKEQGLTRCIGLTGHHDMDALTEGVRRYPFDVILFPLNIVERQAVETLLPLCAEREVVITIMKPVATGLLPATLALQFVLSHPEIACACPGTTELSELVENCCAGDLDPTLTAAERMEVERWRSGLDNTRCRVCARCLPCHVEIPIAGLLGTEVLYDHYRTMGGVRARTFPWGDHALEEYPKRLEQNIELIQRCDDCGDCEPRCPWDLPITTMLRNQVEPMRELAALLREKGDAA
jgi:predicted aldo/keto reductase-like oxidoreductase